MLAQVMVMVDYTGPQPKPQLTDLSLKHAREGP